MMTRKSYHKIIFRTYLGTLVLWGLICAVVEACMCWDFRIPGMDEHLLLPMLSTSRLVLTVSGLLFVLPALCTWALQTLVRITNNLEALTEEERTKSFVERLSRTQLFLPISLATLVFPVLQTQHICDSTFIPGMDFYSFAAFNFLAAWLLTLLFQCIARIRKSGRKALAIIGFILLGITYEIAATTYIFRRSEPTYIYFERRNSVEYPDGCDDEGSQSVYDAMNQEELADQQTERLLDVYDYYRDRDMNALFGVAGRVFEYTEYRNFDVGLSDDDSPEEIARKNAIAEENFNREQELSKFYAWFKELDGDDTNSLIDFLVKAMRSMNGRYNYKDFALYVDMLDMAYNDINANWSQDSDDPFAEIYRQASETPITWENFRTSNIITDPYVRYSVAKDGNAQHMLLWAYSFWGRRDNDGTKWLWRNLIDHILEVHPNTHYPESLLYNYSTMYTQASTRVKEFLTWYKANYWSFRELKAVSYDGQSRIEKIDHDQFTKYLHALEKSGYIAPQLLKRLETNFDRLGNAILGQKPNEWLREDPLIPGYNTYAGQFDEAVMITDSIVTPGQSMHVGTSVSGLGAFVENIDGEWYISGFSQGDR